MRHPRADIVRLYVKSENSGRELIQRKLTNKTTTVGLKKYFDTTDWMLQFVNTNQKRKKKYSFSKESNKFTEQLDLTPKEIGIKDNKKNKRCNNRKKRRKSTMTKSIFKKTPMVKKLDDTHKELKILIKKSFIIIIISYGFP